MGGGFHLVSGRGPTPITDLRIAETPWRRMRGLLGRSHLPRGAGLLIRPCGGIHTLGMRFPIDVIFLDPAGAVLAIARRVVPWRIAPGPRGTQAVLEVQSGWLADDAIRVGDVLRVAHQSET
jgi:uncharacterized membrane protein (UPF0127 family)